jgi:hypothetical protein
MKRVVALALSIFVFGGSTALAGTVHFTGLGDASPLVAASGDLSLGKGGFLTSGTGKTTNLVTGFAEVNATTVAGMGTLTVILTEPSTSGWLFLKLYTASGGEIQVGIGDNEVDDTISAYITLDGELNTQVVVQSTGFSRSASAGRLADAEAAWLRASICTEGTRLQTSSITLYGSRSIGMRY